MALLTRKQEHISTPYVGIDFCYDMPVECVVFIQHLIGLASRKSIEYCIDNLFRLCWHWNTIAGFINRMTNQELMRVCYFNTHCASGFFIHWEFIWSIVQLLLELICGLCFREMSSSSILVSVSFLLRFYLIKNMVVLRPAPLRLVDQSIRSCFPINMH